MFRIKEVADVFVDACVRDEEGRLLLLSCFGRDTAIQQLFAAFYLKVSEGGLEVFHLLEPNADASDAGQAVRVGSAEGLQKLAGRLPRENVFGNLAHTWIYDPVIVRPDRATRTHTAQVYAFVAGDGKPFVIHLSSPEKFWKGLTRVAGHPEWLEDPRFNPRRARQPMPVCVHAVDR